MRVHRAGQPGSLSQSEREGYTAREAETDRSIAARACESVAERVVLQSRLDDRSFDVRFFLHKAKKRRLMATPKGPLAVNPLMQPSPLKVLPERASADQLTVGSHHLTVGSHQLTMSSHQLTMSSHQLIASSYYLSALTSLGAESEPESQPKSQIEPDRAREPAR